MALGDYFPGELKYQIIISRSQLEILKDALEILSPEDLTANAVREDLLAMLSDALPEDEDPKEGSINDFTT